MMFLFVLLGCLPYLFHCRVLDKNELSALHKRNKYISNSDWVFKDDITADKEKAVYLRKFYGQQKSDWNIFDQKYFAYSIDDASTATKSNMIAGSDNIGMSPKVHISAEIFWGLQMIVILFGLFVFVCLCFYVQRNKYFPVSVKKPLKKVNNERIVVNDIISLNNQSNYYPQANIIMKIFDFFNNGSEYRQNAANFGFTPISVALDNNNDDDSGSGSELEMDEEEIVPIVGNTKTENTVVDVCDANIDFDGEKKVDEYASDIGMSSNESDEKNNDEDDDGRFGQGNVNMDDIVSHTNGKTEVQLEVQSKVESFKPMVNIIR